MHFKMHLTVSSQKAEYISYLSLYLIAHNIFNTKAQKFLSKAWLDESININKKLELTKGGL